MYENQPVMIPDAPGKITIKKKGGSEYIEYLIERQYDPVRKYNRPEKRIIGIRIPSLPEMMLPNQNYRKYIPEGAEYMNDEQKKTAVLYAADKKKFIMLREMFDQMYYEFQVQSRRKPDEIVNAYKARKINSILEPLREMMAGEDYAGFLDLIDQGGGAEDGQSGTNGKTYSDAALMLTQYKGAMKRFFSEKM